MATIKNPDDLFSKAVQSNGEGNVVEDSRSVVAVDSFFEGVGNKLRLGLIPAGVEVHEIWLELPDSDDGSNLIVDVGFENADGSSGAVSDFLIDGSSGMQSGAVSFRYNSAPATDGADDTWPVPVSQKDRFITLTVMTGAGGSNSGGGTFRSYWRGVTKGVQ